MKKYNDFLNEKKNNFKKEDFEVGMKFEFDDGEVWKVRKRSQMYSTGDTKRPGENLIPFTLVSRKINEKIVKQRSTEESEFTIDYLNKHVVKILNESNSEINEFKKVNMRAFKQHELDDIVSIIGHNTDPANFTAAILLELDEKFSILDEVMQYLP